MLPTTARCDRAARVRREYCNDERPNARFCRLRPGMGSDHNLGMVSAFAAVAGMVKKSEPPPLSSWDMFEIVKKSMWLLARGV
jgi:hypothetical protein